MSDKDADIIIRTLDAWLLADPVGTIDLVTAWLESVEVQVIDPVLEAELIDEI